MYVSQENRAVMANSSVWAKFVAMLKVLAEYTNDYLGGHKHIKKPYLKREKQK